LEYGYEFWIPVDKNEKPVDDVRIVEFMGGTYATTLCNGAESIFKNWQELFGWCKENKMEFGYHQPLEKMVENITDIQKIVVELYVPIIVD
jgi:effector-binding domain-containing protein